MQKKLHPDQLLSYLTLKVEDSPSIFELSLCNFQAFLTQSQLCFSGQVNPFLCFLMFPISLGFSGKTVRQKYFGVLIPQITYDPI